MRSITEIKEQQKLMKTDPSWSGVSRELFKKGIDSEKVFIATYFSEDVNQEYWTIVTFDRAIYEFYYDWSLKEVSEGEIIEWHDFTNNLEGVYMKEEVQDVLINFEALKA